MSISDNLKVLKEVLIKSGNGQWELKKTNISEEEALIKAKNFDNLHREISDDHGHKDKWDKHRSGVEDIMTLLKESSTKGDQAKIDKHIGMLRKYVLRAPKGSIDLGHLWKHQQQLERNVPRDRTDPNSWKMRPVHWEHMAEFINHHAGKAKNLKDIHDNHGGMDAVKAVLKQHGANGIPKEYTPLNLPDFLHHESMDLMNPGKGVTESSYDPSLQGYQRTGAPTYDKSIYAQHHDQNLHQKVLNTYDEMSGGEDGWNETAATAHGKAAMDRAVDAFKKAHKL